MTLDKLIEQLQDIKSKHKDGGSLTVLVTGHSDDGDWELASDIYVFSAIEYDKRQWSGSHYNAKADDPLAEKFVSIS